MLTFPGISLKQASLNLSQSLTPLQPLELFRSLSATFSANFDFQIFILGKFFGNLFGGVFITGYSHINESAFLIPIVLDDNVKTVCRNFSIRMNRHVIENGDVLLFLDVYCYYCLLCHSLCWCSFSAGLKACTCSVIHSSHHSGSYTKHLPEDSCRSQHADLLDLCHSSSF